MKRIKLNRIYKTIRKFSWEQIGNVRFLVSQKDTRRRRKKRLRWSRNPIGYKFSNKIRITNEKWEVNLREI